MLKADIKKLEADLEEKDKEIEINKLRLLPLKDNANQELAIASEKQKIELERIRTETQEVVSILEAIQPELIATMKAVGNQELAKVLAQNLPKAAGSFGLLTNKGGIDALMNMVKGTPLEEGLTTLLGLEHDKTENKDDKTNK